MALPRFITKPVGYLAKGAGAVQDLAPGKGTSTLSNAGAAIVDPNRVFTGSLNPFSSSYNSGGRGNGSTSSGFAQVSTPATLGANTSTRPNAPETPIPGPTGSTSGSGGTSYDPGTAAYWGDRVNQLRAVLGALPGQRDQGTSNIENSYNRDLGRSNQDESRTLRDIGIKRETNDQNKLREVGRVDRNVANTADSWRRITGMAHSGNSAFAKEFIPVAVARMGSQQRGEAFRTAGENARNLDLTQQDAGDQFKRSREDLGLQRLQRLREFLGGVQDQENGLNDQAAEAAFSQQQALGGNADAVKSAISPFSTSLADRIAKMQSISQNNQDPQFNVQPVNVSVPELSNYTADPLVAMLTGEDPNTPVQDLPYITQLRKRFAGAA